MKNFKLNDKVILIKTPKFVDNGRFSGLGKNYNIYYVVVDSFLLTISNLPIDFLLYSSDQGDQDSQNVYCEKNDIILI